MNIFRVISSEITKFRYKTLNLAIIEYIPTALFNEILESVCQSDWKKTFEYDGFDAWIDYGKVKLKQGDSTLVFKWDNYMEGTIIGHEDDVNKIAENFELKAKKTPSWIKLSTTVHDKN